MIERLVMSKVRKASGEAELSSYEERGGVVKVRITRTGERFFEEAFTKTQVFHRFLSEEDVKRIYETYPVRLFHHAIMRADKEEEIVMVSKRGRVTRLVRKLKDECASSPVRSSLSKEKNYILKEGERIDFLVSLGIMNEAGRVKADKKSKFRQINRYLELLRDVLPSITSAVTTERKLTVIDIGSGKSYLTFAVYHYLKRILSLPVRIIGVDIREDVVASSSRAAREIGAADIRDFSFNEPVDIVISLHACDTASDMAIDFAMRMKSRVVMCVPCCHKALRRAFPAVISSLSDETRKRIQPLLKHGIVKERLLALFTDALRAKRLEDAGYKVDIMEFIDERETAKNLLIRAVLPHSK